MDPAFTYKAAAGDKPKASSPAAEAAPPPPPPAVSSSIDTGAAGAAPPAPPLPPPSRTRTFLDDVLPDTDCDFCLDTRAKLAGALAAVGRAAESSTGAASGGVASGVSALRTRAAAAKRRVDQFVETGTSHAAATEEAAFARLKGDRRESGAGHRRASARCPFSHPPSSNSSPPHLSLSLSHAAGITYAADRPNATAAIAATTLILALPLTRRSLWRATFGRLQSEEARVRRAVDRAASASEVVASVRAAADKAGARADAALTEYERARAGMVTVAASLRALERQAAGAEREAAAALENLRGVPVPPAALHTPPPGAPAGLPPPPALAARGEAANAAADARAARRAIADRVWGVARFGF